MRFVLLDQTQTPFLAGATFGAAVLARAVASLGSLRETVVFLDFGGVEAATGSFLREFVLGLRDFCHRSERNLTVVVANPSGLVVEEFHDLLARLRDAMLCCQLGPDDSPHSPFLVGQLEDAQRTALAAVLELGAADANTLTARQPAGGDRIGPTGWNNRLAALAAKGILRETRRGRAKTYHSTVEGLSLGS